MTAANRISSLYLEAVGVGAGKNRVSNAYVEALASGPGANRLSTAYVEVVSAGVPANRVSTLYIEAVGQPRSVNRVSTIYVEAILSEAAFPPAAPPPSQPAPPVPARQVVPDYISDGVQTTFGFPFAVGNAMDVTLLQSTDGVVWSALAASSRAITAEGEALLTVAAPPPKGTIVRCLGYRRIQRLTSVTTGGAPSAPAYDAELDALVATIAELRRDAGTLASISASPLLAQYFATMPTSPGTPGAPWNDDGVVKIS